MKTYENNMADQDVVVHSLRVLSDIKNPALSSIKRDLSLQQASAQALATKTDKFYKSLSDDGVINPMEKKIVQREMGSIATSYTALYTQAVAEHYEQADFFQDYMATYEALHNYIYSTLHLFDNMEEDTEVDRDEFNEYFSDYYYSENTAIVSMTVGVITEMGFKVLTSLEDEGEDGQVGIYHGGLYQYADQQWKPIDRELYYGKSEVLPPAMEGRYFLCTKDGILSDILYVNDEPLEVNGEALELGNSYEKGVIYVYENYHWEPKDPDDDYRYIVALGDYYYIKEELPKVFNSEIETTARKVALNKYYGPLIVPPTDPEENDFFLYKGTTSGDWIFANLYMWKNGDWVWLNESLVQNHKFYMEALQDILSIVDTETGYFNAVFCNAFFSNVAALNELSTQVIYLKEDGVIKSINYEAGTQGILIDADGNMQAYGNTIIGQDAVIHGNITGATGTFEGDLDIAGQAVLRGRTIIQGDATLSGDIISGPLELTSVSPTPIVYNYPAGSHLPFGIKSNLVGTYKGTINFDKYSCGGGSGTGLDLYLNGVRVYREEHTGVYTSYHTLDYNMTYYYNGTSGSKTFKLKNLPSTQPAETNTVWRDSSGYLRIS